MSDKRGASATLVGDAWGRSAAYDGYADGLHTYCLSLLGDHQVTAEVMRIVFTHADRHIGQLRDADMMQPWLYALTRVECRLRLSGAPGPAPLLPDASAAAYQTPQEESLSALEASLRRAELQLLTWPEAQSLDPDLCEALELTVRHGLSVRGLAAVLGLTETATQDMLTRAWQQLERSQAVVALMKAGPAGCTERALILLRAKVLTATSRRTLLDHSERCVTCRSVCSRAAGSPALPGLLPLIPAPRALRECILGDLERTGSDRAASDARIVAFDVAGFPVHPGPSRQPRACTQPSRMRRVIAVSAAAAALAATGAATLLGGGGPAGRYPVADQGGSSPQVEVRQAVPAEVAPADPPGTATLPDGSDDAAAQAGPEIVIVPSAEAPPPRSRPTVLPAGTTAGAVPGAQPGAPPGAQPGAAPSAPGTGVPPAPPKAPGSLDIQAMNRSGRRGEAEIRLFNSGGMPVSWTAVSSADHLRLSKSSGTLAPGAHETVTVAADRDSVPDGRWRATIRFQPGDSAVTVTGDADSGPRTGRRDTRGPRGGRHGAPAPSRASVPSQPASPPSGSAPAGSPSAS